MNAPLPTPLSRAVGGDFDARTRAAVSCAPTRSTGRLFPRGLNRGGGRHRGRGERPEAESDDEGAGDLGSIALEGLGCRGRLEEQGFFVDFAGHLGSALEDV